MKRILFALGTLVLIGGIGGCRAVPCRSTCPNHGDSTYYDGSDGSGGISHGMDGAYETTAPSAMGRLHGRHHGRAQGVPDVGPPTATVTYPYYTIRGPRDFLVENPPSIGN